jgi:hypothetical protein
VDEALVEGVVVGDSEEEEEEEEVVAVVEEEEEDFEDEGVVEDSEGVVVGVVLVEGFRGGRGNLKYTLILVISLFIVYVQFV